MQHKGPEGITSYNGVTAQYEEITPELASQWLTEFNKMNRKVRPKRALLYADSMMLGEWDGLNGDTIRFDSEGIIADGQHRLQGIITSERPQVTLVVRGIRPESRTTIDDNIRRLFSDDLSMNGEMSAMVRAALLRTCLVFDTAGGLADLTKTSFTRRHMALSWPTYADEIRDTEEETRRWNMRWAFVGNSGAMRFMYWLLKHRVKCDIRAVERFFSIIAIGSQDPADDILIKLRAWMMKSIQISPSGHKSYGPAHEQVYHMIRAWNAWLGMQDKISFAMPKGGYKNPYPMPVPAVSGNVKK